MNKLDTLYELLEKSCHDIIQSEESWLSFLKTSGYLYNFNFTNQLLIYQQRPDAKACTDFETWNNRMNRWIKKGSKGIALIDDGGRYTKIRYVFDIVDTRSPHNRELHLWSVQESFHKQLIDKIAKQFDMTSNDEDLGSFIKEIAKEQTGYYVDDYFKRLMKLKDGSLLESYEENELKNLYRNLLENSVAYSLMSRCDIETGFYFEADVHDVVVRKCRFINNEGPAVLYYGDSWAGINKGCVIDSCYIEGNNWSTDGDYVGKVFGVGKPANEGIIKNTEIHLRTDDQTFDCAPIVFDASNRVYNTTGKLIYGTEITK